MKTLIPLILLFVSQVSLAGIFGSSGTDDDCTQNHSVAWCVMNFADLKDGPPDSTKERMFVARDSSVGQVIDGVGRTAIAAQGVGQLAGVVRATPGFGGGTSGVLNLLSAFSADRAPSVQMIALMPQGEVKNDDPGSTMEQILVSAVVDWFRNDGVIGAELVTEEKKHLFGTDIRRTYRLRGGKCDSSMCEVTSGFFSYNKAKPGTKVSLPAWTEAKGEGFLWREGVTSVFPQIRLDGKFSRLSPAHLLEISRRMPRWFYVYMPPASEGSLPVMLSQGEPHWFFKPGQEPDWLPKSFNDQLPPVSKSASDALPAQQQ